MSKPLLGKSVLYGLGSALLKVIGILLIPIYTRYLSTADFGTMDLTRSASIVLSVLFALELREAINYFYIYSNVDVSLNLLLIPRYGMIAAACSGFASKIVMVIVVTLLTNKVYPIPYEYVRIGKLLSVVLALFAASLLIPSGSLWVSLAEKLALFMSFPLFLYCLQFFTSDEKRGIISTLKELGFSKGKTLL